jgi:agmatine deiminase
MITDPQTNTLFLADSLPIKYPTFYKAFEKILTEQKINFKLLPGTKDVWAVDYMPIQVQKDKFIQFVYNPIYLQSQKLKKTISNVLKICHDLKIETIKSPIVLDGGNVVRTTDKVIITDRIFKENPAFEPKFLLSQISDILEVEEIFLIPEQPHDFTGHADGMARFIDEHTILINDYRHEKEAFQRAFRIAIHNSRLNYVELPYNPYGNANYDQANGDYINYLQMEGIVMLPVFGIKEDELVIRQFEKVFPGQRIVAIPSNEIAKDGGILNCISWNIKN